ncbi:hypothetical protein KY290_037063 [Solanum tuberosum]|uniref:Putative plant transposon protein domain-containing protein n=1 Tax=Solanum tuberosum TaxID=4113 RepID=A0ABQ7TV62_SOLTU|nr:hypothetical protein KY290_037063 [Solanum tuberosum]
MFDQTLEFGVYPSSDSTNTDEDNRPLRWIVQKKMVPISTKGKEKVSEEIPKRRPFTRSDSKKLMGDAMKSSITTTAERRKKRKSSNVLFKIPDTNVVDVLIEDSEHEGVGKSSEARMEMQVKMPGKGKSKASVAKRVVSKKGKNKRKRETSPVIEPTSGTRPGPMKVLGGRVFDPDIITKHGMNSLHDLVEIQSWTHLFQTKSPVLHEEKVRKFYYNIEFEEDGSINTRVGDKSLHLTEELLGQVLGVPREGTRSVVGKTCNVEFVKECSKIPNTRHAGIQKKFIKGEYQLLFEFVNKVLLPRTEKRTVASASDLFIMGSLCKFDPIDLPSLMLEHMYKTVVDHKGKHDIGYGYFLTKVFHHLNIPVGASKIGTAKQSFTLSTLVECECIEGKGNHLSKVSQLVMEQDELQHELEEMTVRVSNKDAEIALLKAELLKAQTEGPGTEEVKELNKQNEKLLAKIVALQEKMIKDNDAKNSRLTLVINSLSHQPSSSQSSPFLRVSFLFVWTVSGGESLGAKVGALGALTGGRRRRTCRDLVKGPDTMKIYTQSARLEKVQLVGAQSPTVAETSANGMASKTLAKATKEKNHPKDKLETD